jgi:hypothetical protein
MVTVQALGGRMDIGIAYMLAASEIGKITGAEARFRCSSSTYLGGKPDAGVVFVCDTKTR